jgi:hypothetical protein
MNECATSISKLKAEIQEAGLANTEIELAIMKTIDNIKYGDVIAKKTKSAPLLEVLKQAKTELIPMKMNLKEKKKQTIKGRKLMYSIINRKQKIETRMRKEMDAFSVVGRILYECKQQFPKDRLDLKKHLPIDLIRYIGEFLPYDTQIQVLETQFNVFKAIYQLSIQGIHLLYSKAVNYPGFIDSIDDKESAALYLERARAVENGIYFEDDLFQMRIKMLLLFFEMKDNCPREALKLMKTLSLIIKPKKKYSAKMPPINQEYSNYILLNNIII